LTGEFSVIEGEVINRLDRLFMQEAKGDQLSRAFFVGQLRELFDPSTTDDTLRSQVDSFLASIDDFLDLLMAVRGLPDGDAVRSFLLWVVLDSHSLDAVPRG
jgi:dedicator of cytokinesis protein 3